MKVSEYILAIAGGILAWFGLLTISAHAGCIGGSLGDACIGIPTPSERQERVVVEHRHRTPMVVEHRRRAPAVFEHNYNHEDEGDE